MYQACLHTATDTGSRWVTLASGVTKKSCINKLAFFLARQPLHHWGIRKESLIRLHDPVNGFTDTLSIN